MALSTNPGKTRRIEQAYRRETRKRFKQYNSDVKNALKASQDRTMVQNVDEFDLTDDELDRFLKFLRGAAYRDIIGATDPANYNSAIELNQTEQWQDPYLTAAYAKGLDSAVKQTRTIADELSLTDLRAMHPQVSEAELARMLAGTSAIHRQAITNLNNQTLTSLVQDIETMLGQLAREVENARIAGDSTATLSRAITERAQIANGTAEQIASTGTTQAAQKAQINHAEALSERIDEKIMVRWITRVDAKVRDLHVNWHGKLMTPEEAEVNITISPWNCRCAFEQVPESKATAKRQEQFDKERKILKDREEKAKLGAI